MAKNKKEEVQPQTGEKVLNLSQMYTLNGKHWGPGETIIPEEFNGMSQDTLIKHLEEAEERAAPPADVVELTEKPSKKITAIKTYEDYLSLGEDELRRLGEERGIPGADQLSAEALADQLKES